MKLIFLLIIPVSLSCSGLSEDFDSFIFSLYGKTVLSRTQNISLTEIHLNQSSLEDKDIIAEGMVSLVGDYNTFAVLTADSARILVVQTQIPSNIDRIKDTDAGKMFKVLGRLVTKKRGLPTIEARSVIPL